MKHKGFLFYQIAGNAALFLFGIIFAVSFIFTDQDVAAVTHAAWRAIFK